MTMPSAELIVSRYIFNTDTRPANILDENLIRGEFEKGDPIFVSSNEYMATGGGRFAGVERFNFVRNFLAGNDSGYINGDILQPGIYTTAELLEKYGIENSLGIQQYYNGVYDDDYANRAYVFGSGNFKINDDALFYVNEDGTRNITNICVEPINDNFDYESSSLPAELTNWLTKDQIDPSGIGRQVPIHFTGTVSRRYDFSSEDVYMLEARNLQAQAAEAMAKLELVAKAVYFGSLFSSIIGRLVSSDIITYEDSYGRYVVYDGKDIDNSNQHFDAKMLLNVTELLPTHGVVMLAGAGNDTMLGTSYDDELRGGDGDDLLYGNFGSDLLLGGSGYDSYRAEHNDIIQDLDGLGRVHLNGIGILRGGTRKETDPEGFYQDGDIIYELSGNTLTVNDGLVINNFINGDLGIMLRQEPEAAVSERIGTDQADYFYQHSYINPGSVDARRNVRAGDGRDMLFGSHVDVDRTGLDAVQYANLQATDDVLEGGAGSDIINGNWGRDLLHGGDGDDFISGFGDGSRAHGGNGNDVLSAVSSNQFMPGQLFPGEDPHAVATTVWRDLEKHMGWSVDPTRIDNLSDDEQTVHFDWNLSGAFDYSGASVRGAGWTYRLYSDGEQTMHIEYRSPSGQVYSMLGGDTRVWQSAELRGAFQNGVSLFGESGNDSLMGSSGDDYLDGGDDNDTLIGNQGNDEIRGGNGQDHLLGGTGSDWLDGGAGHDQLRGQDGTDHLHGGSGDDVLVGDAGDGEDGVRDYLLGEDGNDRLFGDGGDDLLDGGAGNDEVAGGSGADDLQGGTGNDKLWGQAGHDQLHGGDGHDWLSGGDGNDRLEGGTGNDTLHGGAGNDLYRVEAGWGTDVIKALRDADAGSDVIHFGPGIDPTTLQVGLHASGELMLSTADGANHLVLEGFLDASASAHSIRFADGTVWQPQDVLRHFQRSEPDVPWTGTTGNDTVLGNAGADSMNGGIGNDILHGSGDDVLTGGLDQKGTRPDTQDHDVLFGGEGNDTLKGQDGNDTLHGGTGDDLLQGGYGADTLRGGDGNDVLQAGNYDALSGYRYEEGSNDVLEGGTGNDVLRGGAGANTYMFAKGFGHDILHLTDKDDFNRLEFARLWFDADITAASVQLAMQGDDLLIQAGTDSIRVADYALRQQASLQLQFADDSQLQPQQLALLRIKSGTEEADELIAGPVGQDLDGKAGHDILRGGTGADTLRGGLGRDTLYGSAGDDVYHYALGDGDDSIDGSYDSTGGVDTLVLDAGITPADVAFHTEGSWATSRLFVVIKPTNSIIRIQRHADGPGRHVDRIVFADGTVISAQQMEAQATVFPHALQFNGLPDGGEVHGNDYANVFNSGTGADVFHGHGGDDVYYLEGSWDTVVEQAGEGYDVVMLSRAGGHTLAAHVEELTANLDGNRTGFHDHSCNTRDVAWTTYRYTGNAAANRIALVGQSEGKPNIIDGGAGADTMIGGRGDDTFVVDDAGDVVIDGGGRDAIESSIDFSLEHHRFIEESHLTGTAATRGEGNDLANVLVGSTSSAANVLAGGAGDDTYVIGSGDSVVELADGGFDTVQLGDGAVGTHHALAFDHVERYALHKKAGRSNLTGTGGNDDLVGNSWGNTIDGGAGDDRITDSMQNPYDATQDIDTLLGGDGHDVLESIAGADVLIGGTGNDLLTGSAAGNVYRFSVGDGHDVLTERGGHNSIEFAASVTHLALQRDGHDLVIDYGAGHATDQVRVKNVWNADGALASNVIGALRFWRDGTPQYWGLQEIVGNLQGQQLIGTSADDTLLGGDGADTIDGGAGNDTIEGGAGYDSLDGGSGNDVYRFSGSFAKDTIHGLGAADAGIDRILLGDSESVGDYHVQVQNGRDVLLYKNTGHDSVMLQDFLLAGTPLHEIRFADGTVWTKDWLRQQLHTGTDDADHLYGWETDDTLTGHGGDDILFGGAGNDLLVGGAGNDRYIASTGLDAIDNTAGGSDTLYFETVASADALTFSRDGDDLLIVANRNTGNAVRVAGHFLGSDQSLDYVELTDGNRLNTTQINARVGGGSPAPTPGDDADYPNVLSSTSAGERLTGSWDRDLLHGLAGNDQLFGMSEDDKLVGGDGDDYLSGGNGYYTDSGNDILIGDAGNDTLVGEDGDDTLFGGGGNDKYVYGGGIDVIDNSGGGTDWILFNSSRLSINRSRLGFHRDGDDLLIRIDGDPNQQVRVYRHFDASGAWAVDYVQPADGYGIPASAIDGLLTDLPQGPGTQHAVDTAAALPNGAMRNRLLQRWHGLGLSDLSAGGRFGGWFKPPRPGCATPEHHDAHWPADPGHVHKPYDPIDVVWAPVLDEVTMPPAVAAVMRHWPTLDAAGGWPYQQAVERWPRPVPHAAALSGDRGRSPEPAGMAAELQHLVQVMAGADSAAASVETGLASPATAPDLISRQFHLGHGGMLTPAALA